MAPLASTMFTASREVLREHEQIGSNQGMRRALSAVLMVAPADPAAFDPAHGNDGRAQSLAGEESC
jgi:hypothetical protein